MTYYARSAYGANNPNAGYPANGDFAAWGGHKWPQGVPASLLGTTNYTSGTTGQTLRVTMRKELVPLWNLIFEIQDRKHHYPVWAFRNGESWGPWGYANRPVAGTQRASGHSGALSVDENAPNNPYSSTFQSDMPPAMVADMESLGLYWGGRYQGQKYDSMHYGFCRAPNTVASYIEKAKKILGKPPAPIPVPPKPKPPVEVDMTPDECRAVVREELKAFFTTAKPIVTDDAASTPGNLPYSYETALERIIRLTSLTYTGQTGKPH
jgi:hypothetical protein